MKRGFTGISLPPNTPLPQDEFFHVDTFAGGYDSRDAQEDLPPGSSPSMLDMEITRDDRLVRAPGITLAETLEQAPTQVLLHPGFKYATELVFLAPPYIGIKRDAGTSWYDVGLRNSVPYGHTNFAGVLLLSNGIKGIYKREPRATTLELVPDAPPALGMTVFAGRLVLGGTLVSGNMDFMGLGWSGTTDYTDWNPDNGAGAESMIGSMRMADRFQAFAPLGFDTLAIINRRSIWIATPTGDVFEPMRSQPRLEDTGCINARTVVPTEFGVIFLSDDGVRVFTGNDAPVVSDQINQELLPVDEDFGYSGSFDPTRKRYYLHTANDTWVFDILKRRWFRWSGQFKTSVFFPGQRPTGPTWGQLVETWGSQVEAWWQLLGEQHSGQMTFVKDTKLGYEDPAVSSVFGTALNPRWFDRRVVADNQDQLMTALGARFTYEANEPASVELWLPNKPHGEPEPVVTGVLPGGTGTRRAWVPFIHTGRGISLGLRLLSGQPRIRKASVEFQRTGMLFDAEYEGVPAPGIPSDAIMKIRPVFTNGYETEGQVWRPRYRSEAFTGARVWTGTGDLVYQPTGGRAGGGYVTSVASTENDFFGNPVGQYQMLGLAPGEAAPKQSAIAVAFNLFGQTLTQPMNCMGWGQDISGFYSNEAFIATVFVQIMPDRTIRFARGTPGNYVAITPSSTQQVPADGWFQIDAQIGASNPGLTDGFALANLHMEGAPPQGYAACRGVEINLGGSFLVDLSGRAWGTEVVSRQAGQRGLNDIGIDDVVVCGPYGTVKRWLGNTFLAAAVPTGPGAETNSEVSHDSRPVLAGNPAFDVGVTVTHGSVDRWRNVTGTPVMPGDVALWGSWWEGAISIFTGTWLFGPFPYPTPVPQYPPNSSPADETIVRNTLYDALRELYKVETARAGIVVIEGLFPYIRSSARYLIGFTSEDAGIEPNGDYSPNGVFSPNVSLVSRYADNMTGLNATHDMKLIVRVSDTEQLSAIESGAPTDPSATNRYWQPLAGYKISPFSFVNTSPLTGARFSPGEIRDLLQIGLVGITGVNPRGQIDYCEIGTEIAYHEEDVNWIEHDPYPPIAGLNFASGTNLPARHIVLKDMSTSWDSTIATVSIDWGDGNVEGVAPGSTTTHDYTVPGVYTIILSVVDANGLTDSVSAIANAYVVNQPPSAVFSYAVEPSDPSGLTVNFTDLSTDDNAVVTWDWDWGDGTAHGTTQNPTHTYASAGQRMVVLIATDSGGEAAQPPLSDSTSALITLPLEIPLGDCVEFTGVPGTMVQGDDFAGGNPPLPAYINTSAFNQYYHQIAGFQYTYYNDYDSTDIAHELDLTRLFRSHPTLKMWFGKPASTTYAGAGWDSRAGTDATPDALQSPLHNSIWYRCRWAADAGVMSQAGLTSGSQFQGLAVADIQANQVDALIANRAGHLYLDLQTRLSVGAAFTTQTYDIGLETTFVGRGDNKFGELIVLAETNEGANTVRIRVWTGEACTLTGVSPILDVTRAAFGLVAGVQLKFDWIYHFNWYFTPTGALKNLWVATWSRMPADTYPNPYGVSLT